MKRSLTHLFVVGLVFLLITGCNPLGPHSQRVATSTVLAPQITSCTSAGLVATITWKPALNATSYTVLVAEYDEQTDTAQEAVEYEFGILALHLNEEGNFTASLPLPKEKTCYQISMQSHSMDGNTSAKSSAQVCHSGMLYEQGAPASLKPVVCPQNISKTGFAITVAPCEGVHYFRVSLNGGSWADVSYNTEWNAFFHEFSDLKNNTTYTVAVVPVVVVDEQPVVGDTVTELSVKTNVAKELNSLSVTYETFEDSVTITATNVPTPTPLLQSGAVMITRLDEGTTSTYDPADPFSVTFDGLEPGKKYTYTIQVRRTTFGQHYYTGLAYVDVFTPLKLELDSQNGTINLSWTAVEHEVSTMVKVFDYDSMELLSLAPLGPVSQQGTVNSASYGNFYNPLKEGITYAFQVESKLADGTVFSSAVVPAETVVIDWTGTYQWVYPGTAPSTKVENYTIEVVAKGKTYKGLAGPSDASEYPYYIYASELDSHYDGTQYRLMPLVDPVLDTTYVPGQEVEYKDTSQSYMLTYRWNAGKWNSSSMSPSSWKIDKGPLDFPSLIKRDIYKAQVVSKAVGASLITTSISEFMMVDGEKYMLFSNSGSGIVNSNLYKNPSPNERLGETDLSYALKQIAAPEEGEPDEE